MGEKAGRKETAGHQLPFRGAVPGPVPALVLERRQRLESAHAVLAGHPAIREVKPDSFSDCLGSLIFEIVGPHQAFFLDVGDEGDFRQDRRHA